MHHHPAQRSYEFYYLSQFSPEASQPLPPTKSHSTERSYTEQTARFAWSVARVRTTGVPEHNHSGDTVELRQEIDQLKKTISVLERGHPPTTRPEGSTKQGAENGALCQSIKSAF